MPEIECSTDVTVDVCGMVGEVAPMAGMIKSNIIDKIESLQPCIEVINCTGYVQYNNTDWQFNQTLKFITYV